MLRAHVLIQGNTSPHGLECLLFFDACAGLNLDWSPVATLLCVLTSHMFWNPVASLTPIPSSLSLSLCWSPICPLLSTYISPSYFSHPQRGVYAGPRGRRRLARRRTSARGSNIRLDLWSNSTNTHCPWRTVSQHASACTGTHRQSRTHFFISHPISLAPPVTLPTLTFNFLRSCLFPSVLWCLRRWHLLLLLLLAHWATRCSPITGLPFTARALRWPITEWLLSCGPAP